MRISQAWYKLRKTLVRYLIHYQWVLALLDKRAAAVSARMSKMKMPGKELQNWGYFYCIHVNVSRNHWPMVTAFGVNSSNELVCSKLLRMGDRSENENSKRELEQPIGKKVLILGRDEVRFPTEEAIDVLRWNELSQGEPCEAAPR